MLSYAFTRTARHARRHPRGLLLGGLQRSTECASLADELVFHDEMRRAACVSWVMRHERVVGDADTVAAFLPARKE